MTVRARAAEPARKRSAQPARTRPVAPTQPRQRPATRTRPRLDIRGLLRWAWIPALMIMLCGIVWLNNSTLQLSAHSSMTIQRINAAQVDINNINSALQQETSQVRMAASHGLGMKQVNPTQVRFLRAATPTR